MRLDGTRRRSVPSGRSAPRACASGRRRLRVRPPPSPPHAPTPFSRVAPNDSPTSPPTPSLPSPPASPSPHTALRATAPHRASAHRPAAASISTFVRTPPSRLSPVSPFLSQALRQPISAVTAGSPQHSAQTSVTHTHTHTHASTAYAPALPPAVRPAQHHHDLLQGALRPRASVAARSWCCPCSPTCGNGAATVSA